MKTRHFLVMALTMSFATAYAQSEEQVLNSDPINVDGYLAEDKPVTDGELEKLKSEYRDLKNQTQLSKDKAKVFQKVAGQVDKFADAQDEMVDGAVERQQALNGFKEKKELNERKLKCIMENIDTEECKQWVKKTTNQAVVEQPLQLTQAAPVVSTAEVALSEESFGPFEKIKLLPYVGGTNYSGKVESLEATASGGLRLESNINSRFSMGIGVNLSQLKTNDFANTNPYMTQSYFGAYGREGREIQFRTMGMDLYGKFFITNGQRFRPYLGAGLGYSRAEMKYTQNNPYSNMYGTFGDENYRNSYAVGNLMAGSEIMINRAVGLNLEAAYSTGIGSSLSSQNGQNPSTSLDQARLQELGNEIINANALSIFAGMVIVF